MEKQRDERRDQGEEKKSELIELEKEIEETRKEVEPSFLSTYDRVATIVSRPPYMAPISDQKCSGCHLRVSNDVVSLSTSGKKDYTVRSMRTHCICGKMSVHFKGSLGVCRSNILLGKSPKNFREAVIRSDALGQTRGKSGHHRVGFLVKAGGSLFQCKFTDSATENKPPP